GKPSAGVSLGRWASVSAFEFQLASTDGVDVTARKGSETPRVVAQPPRALSISSISRFVRAMMWISLRSQSVLLVICLVFTLAAVNGTSGQDVVVPYQRGQNVVPVFEGWEQNPDGTFNMVFGYLNRNYEEMLDIPIGPNNMIEPGLPDQGQPTHFFARRGWFVFRIKVPSDFGNRELVWTLTSRGRTEKAYATLKPDYVMDKTIMMSNNDGAEAMRGNERQNEWPTIRVEGDTRRTVKVGQPLTLTAIANDDGMPVAAPWRSRSGSGGTFRAGWYVYRGAGKVTFDPGEILPSPLQWGPRDAQAPKAETANATAGSQSSREAQTPTTYDVFAIAKPIPVVDRKVSVTVTFTEPGTYVLRALAHDGGLD